MQRSAGKLPVLESQCADLLKVLADETRLRVLRSLLAGPRQVAQINEDLQIEQSLLSHHLKVLREAGLVESERQGKGVLYRLRPGVACRRSGEAIDLGCCQLSFQ